MKNYKLSMTTDILAPRIKHLTSVNSVQARHIKALKNKIKELEKILSDEREFCIIQHIAKNSKI